jgi:hypothetical protein
MVTGVASSKRGRISLEGHKDFLRVDVAADVELIHIVPGAAGFAGVLDFCAPMVGPEAAGA